MKTRFKDLGSGLRVLLQSRVVTVSAVLALIAGGYVIGGADSLLRRPRHFRVLASAILHHMDRIIVPGVVSPASHSSWKNNNNQVFGDITAAVDLARVNLTGAGAPEELLAGEVTPNFFEKIGVQPMLGRGFQPEEDQRGHEHVAILSHGLWRRRFAGDTGMIGRSIVLNGESHQVIGVLPRDFSWNNQRTDVWVPYLMDSRRDERLAGAHYLRVAFERHHKPRVRAGVI